MNSPAACSPHTTGHSELAPSDNGVPSVRVRTSVWLASLIHRGDRGWREWCCEPGPSLRSAIVGGGAPGSYEAPQLGFSRLTATIAASICSGQLVGVSMGAPGTIGEPTPVRIPHSDRRSCSPVFARDLKLTAQRVPCSRRLRSRDHESCAFVHKQNFPLPMASHFHYPLQGEKVRNP